MMIFFLNAEEKVYARYGGRDAEGPDTRQSLAGLHYTMHSVLAMHEQKEKTFAPKTSDSPRYLREAGGGFGGGRGFGGGGRCLHCHQVKEVLNANAQRSGKWTSDLVWRYPLPENLGMTLEIDRGNVIKMVKDRSAAAVTGLKVGDLLQRLNGVPIHSFGDAQYALDRAPKTGTIEVEWKRGDKVLKEKLTLAEGWRKTDITWRPSMQRMLPAARLTGPDLTAEEKKALGLSAKQLAFRQKENVSSQAKAAGIQGGDIILGVDGKMLEMDNDEFLSYVRSNYIIGDRLAVNLIRAGKRMNLPMTLTR